MNPPPKRKRMKLFPLEDTKTKEAKETKETLQEESVKLCSLLCLKYHKEHSKGYNMDSLPKDKRLYALFRKFLDSKYWKVLPPHWKFIITHRYLYVRLMVELGSQTKIRKFVKEFQPGYQGQNLADSSFQVLFKKVKESTSYKDLTDVDIQYAYRTVSNVIDDLKHLTYKGDLRAKAMADCNRLKIRDNIDDQYAAPRLRSGLLKVQRNILALMYKKERDAKMKKKPRGTK